VSQADQQKLKEAQQYLEKAFGYLERSRQLLFSQRLSAKIKKISSSADKSVPSARTSIKSEKIIEGIFDGEEMIDASGKQYPVAENYASKSKLVAGDRLKLIISADGEFRFKQIGPIERKKRVGKLIQTGENWEVKIGEKHYRILKASVTYYKAKIGDRLTVIIPKNEDSVFAAVDNVIGGTNVG